MCCTSEAHGTNVGEECGEYVAPDPPTREPTPRPTPHPSSRPTPTVRWETPAGSDDVEHNTNPGNTDDQGNTGGSSDNDGSGDNDGSDLLGVVGIVVGGIVFLALLAAAVFVYVHKLRSSYNKMPADQMPAVETMAVEMSEICVNKIDSSSVAGCEHALASAAD